MTTDFNGFGLPPKLLHSLARMQFETPTPIQAQAIPLALAGRDILGSAQTGTGKTGAFGIPLVAKLMDNTEAAGLIMTPTRELATQVAAALQQMIPVSGLRIAVLIGGEPMPKQFRQLQAHPRLIIGTPGRINDHLERKSLKLNNTRFLVLDETDRMLDMGFGAQIERIVAHIPKERQTMLFSATLPAAIVKLSSKYLNNPERISVGATHTAAPNIHQELIHSSDSEKYPQLLEQLKTHKGSAIIFVKTKYGTEKLAAKLSREGHQADAIHGDLRQSRRDRVIQSFRDKKFRILVATDLAARGLDVPHIELVINYDMPQAPEDYIHRIGRTARAGASGKAINFLTGADRAKWNAIQRLMNPGAPRTNEPRERSFGEKRPNKFKRGGFKHKPRKDWHEKRGEGGAQDGEQRRDHKSHGEHRSEHKGGHRSEHRTERHGEGRAEHRGEHRDRKPHGEHRHKDHGERKERRPHDGERRDHKPHGEHRSEYKGGHRSEHRSERHGEGRPEHRYKDHGDRKDRRPHEDERRERPAHGERRDRKPHGDHKGGPRTDRPGEHKGDFKGGRNRRPFNKGRSNHKAA